MPANTLSTIFYALGSVFFVMAIVIVVGLAIGSWIAYRKIIRLRNTAITKLTAKRTALTSISTLAPVVLTGLVNAFLSRRKK